MFLTSVLATTLWSVPLSVFLTSESFTTSKLISLSTCLGLISYLSYSAVHSLEPNYYEILGTKHTASFDDIQSAFRQTAQRESNYTKTEIEHMYQAVRGANRKVYAKHGDHITRTKAIVIDQVVSVGHAFAVALLLSSVAAIFLSYRPAEISTAARVYMLAVFCIDFWAREVDHTFLPVKYLDMLPFEILNMLVAFFPAVCCFFIMIGRFFDFKGDDERKSLAIRRLLTSNTELILAVKKLPAECEIEDDTHGYNNASDSGAVLSQCVAALLLLANIILGTE